MGLCCDDTLRCGSPPTLLVWSFIGRKTTPVQANATACRSEIEAEDQRDDDDEYGADDRRVVGDLTRVGRRDLTIRLEPRGSTGGPTRAFPVARPVGRRPGASSAVATAVKPRPQPTGDVPSRALHTCPPGHAADVGRHVSVRRRCGTFSRVVALLTRVIMEPGDGWSLLGRRLNRWLMDWSGSGVAWRFRSCRGRRTDSHW